MKLVIGNKNYSSWSLRPWLLMRGLGIAFDEEVVALYAPHSAARLAAVSPSGKVPVLLDGHVTVWDSLAIAEYLAEKFASLPVWPTAPAPRATARCVTAEMHSGFAALRSAMPMNLRAQHPGKGRSPAVDADIARVTAIWEGCRREHGIGGDFLFGQFGAADAFFAPVVTRFETYGVELHGAAGDYAAAVRALPAMQQWTADALLETETIAASEPYAEPPAR